MSHQLQPNSGTDAAILFALEALIRARAALDIVFHDHPKDLVDPSRKPFLRRQYEELGAAIGELQRARSNG